MSCWSLCCAALVWCVSVSMGCAGSAAAPRHAHVSARDDGPALLKHAEQLAAHGDWVRAEQYALAAERAGMPSARVVPLLIDVCIRASRLSAALHHALPALRAEPDHAHLRYLVALLYASLDRRAEALATLEPWVTLHPEHHHAAALLGRVQEQAP